MPLSKQGENYGRVELLSGGVRWCRTGEGPRGWLGGGNVGGVQAGGASGKLPFEQGKFPAVPTVLNTHLSAMGASAGDVFVFFSARLLTMAPADHNTVLDTYSKRTRVMKASIYKNITTSAVVILKLV